MKTLAVVALLEPLPDPTALKIQFPGSSTDDLDRFPAVPNTKISGTAANERIGNQFG